MIRLPRKLKFSADENRTELRVSCLQEEQDCVARSERGQGLLRFDVDPGVDSRLAGAKSMVLLPAADWAFFVASSSALMDCWLFKSSSLYAHEGNELMLKSLEGSAEMY